MPVRTVPLLSCVFEAKEGVGISLDILSADATSRVKNVGWTRELPICAYAWHNLPVLPGSASSLLWKKHTIRPTAMFLYCFFRMSKDAPGYWLGRLVLGLRPACTWHLDLIEF